MTHAYIVGSSAGDVFLSGVELRSGGREGLRADVDVMLVTSAQHPEGDAARDYELVLDPRPKKPTTWPALLRPNATLPLPPKVPRYFMVPLL